MKRVGVTLVFGMAVAYASACCSVSRNGIPVHFQDQSDIVIWNPETKTEHFVRIANFQSEAESFGFIAPTPSVPELELANAKAFRLLAGEKPRETSFGCSASVAAKSAGAVNVIRDLKVGAYRAQTLDSKDAAALAKYIQNNGFSMGQDVKTWVQHYVDKGWYLTIFTLGENTGGVSRLDAIRMTFKTDKPFCPFYVPSSSLPKDRGTLQVFFVSNGSYSPNLGNSGDFQKPNWYGSLNLDKKKMLAQQLKLSENEIPDGAVISAITYDGFPSGATEDLFFSRDLIQGWMVGSSKAIIAVFLVGWLLRRTIVKARAKRSVAA